MTAAVIAVALLTCGFVLNNRIVKGTSPLDHDVGHGHLCVTGRFGFKFVQRRAGES